MVGQPSPAVRKLLVYSAGIRLSSLSSEYIVNATPICLRFDRQTMVLALSFAAANAGSSKAASTAMMAMTTINSTRVKACAKYGEAVFSRSEIGSNARRTGFGWRPFRIQDIG